MMWRRRRSLVLLVLLMVSGFLTIKLVGDTEGVHADTAGTTDEKPSTAPPTTAVPDRAEPSTSSEPPEEPRVVEQGDGTWTYAEPPSHPPVLGDTGTLLTFNVAVEEGIDQDVSEFTEVVTDTLGDDRSWTAGGQWRFTQADGEEYVDFTVYLASPRTRAELCGAADYYTSCRNGDAVVVNLERWLLGVPHWKGDLGTYRQYVVNHEVGHRLGEGHMVCPKKGSPSPVMAQQTLELRGCTENPWPYVDGDYLTGPAGEYQ